MKLLADVGIEWESLTEELVQILWKGNGELVRLHIVPKKGEKRPPLILKKVQLNARVDETDGELDPKQQLKAKSYAIERQFYLELSTRLIINMGVRMPHLVNSSDASTRTSVSITLLLSDLKAEGFMDVSLSASGMTIGQVLLATDWLARFHACGLGEGWESLYQLWPEGCYWGLDARRDEWHRLLDSDKHKGEDETFLAGQLYHAAPALASRLRSAQGFARGWTCVHGDFKAANLLLSDTECAALDFQYVGGGFGVRDLAAFVCKNAPMDSSADPSSWLAVEMLVLDTYHRLLVLYAGVNKADIVPTRDDITHQYEVALLDFVRFQLGWGAWGNVFYSLFRARAILKDLAVERPDDTEAWALALAKRYPVKGVVS